MSKKKSLEEYTESWYQVHPKCKGVGLTKPVREKDEAEPEKPKRTRCDIRYSMFKRAVTFCRKYPKNTGCRKNKRRKGLTKIEETCKRMTEYSSRGGWQKDCAGKMDKAEYFKRWFDEVPECAKTAEPIKVTLPQKKEEEKEDEDETEEEKEDEDDVEAERRPSNSLWPYDRLHGTAKRL